MGLTDQWDALEARLPSGWESASLRVRPEREDDLAETARLLGSTGVGRVGGELALTVFRAGGTESAQAVRRAFGRVDAAQIACRLGHAGTTDPTTTAATTDPSAEVTAMAAWDAALEGLPHDWSDALARFTLRSSDELDRAALLCAALNPSRDGDRLAFVFRCARTTGYGASPVTARRAFERLDQEGIPVTVEVLRTLAATHNVGTQGSSWVVGGRHL